MKKAVYRLILFAAITAFVLFLSASVKAEPNSTEPNQQVRKAAPISTTYKADKPRPAPHQKSAGSKENSQLQLAKEQLRGEFYKDSQDNLKWALGIIIAIVLGLIIYTIFKDRKEYEKACENAEKAYDKAEQSRTQAEQSREKAREHELKAQEKLASISKLVADKLKEIDTKAKETMDAIKAEAKAGQVEIEKIGNEERQKSLEEAERQRKISELFKKGLTALEAKDYETAADCYRQIEDELKEENDPYVYHNWGNALTQLARNKKGKEAEELFKQALEKYQKAIKIKPSLCEPYANCGTALIELAERKKGKEAEELLNQAIGKCKKAVEIKPDYWSAYNEWGIALIDLAKLKGGKDAEDLLKQAEEKCLKAESIKTGGGAYNLACVYALLGNEDKCQEWLKIREKEGTLPSREHAMADDDLKSIREKDWFKKLRWKGE
ncbi:MAG: tetratricopeptide repeat protein [Planctomycetota bacterium]|jgi:tetratricopeptide (TPR) repeat protein